MDAWFDIAQALETRLRAAAQDLGWTDAFTPDVRTADPRFKDFQANGVLPYAEATGQAKQTRALAQALADAFIKHDDTSADMRVSVAGPGFINFALQAPFLRRWLTAFDQEADLRRGAGTRLAGQTWVVDFGSPNTAK